MFRALPVLFVIGVDFFCCRYHLEFVDVSYVTREIVRPLATTMKKLFNNHGGEYFMTVNHSDPNKTRSVRKRSIFNFL